MTADKDRAAYIFDTRERMQLISVEDKDMNFRSRCRKQKIKSRKLCCEGSLQVHIFDLFVAKRNIPVVPPLHYQTRSVHALISAFLCQIHQLSKDNLSLTLQHIQGLLVNGVRLQYKYLSNSITLSYFEYLFYVFIYTVFVNLIAVA
jgi:hypothetical protein